MSSNVSAESISAVQLMLRPTLLPEGFYCDPPFEVRTRTRTIVVSLRICVDCIGERVAHYRRVLQQAVELCEALLTRAGTGAGAGAGAGAAQQEEQRFAHAYALRGLDACARVDAAALRLGDALAGPPAVLTMIYVAVLFNVFKWCSFVVLRVYLLCCILISVSLLWLN